MCRFFKAAVIALLLTALSACSGNPFPSPVSVTVTNTFSTVQIGASPITLMATVANAKGNAGVKWALTLGNQNCSPSCGTLTPAQGSGFSATYTAPPTLPTNQSATITATSVADSTAIFVFTSLS